MTKARVVCGPAEFAERIQQLILTLTFERPLPDDLQGEIYRLRGRMEKELGKETAAQLNIKTGRGGMVDVEFLTQFLQLQHAGRVKELRQANTLELLKVMAQQQLLPATEAEQLITGYKFLRRLENKLRLLHDQSMNELSAEPKTLRKIARSLGYGAPGSTPEQELLDEYRLHTEAIRGLFERYLNPLTTDLTREGV